MHRPLSIIIPVRQGGSVFRECLPSIIEAGQAANAEIIVVADGCPDSAHIARQMGVDVLLLPVPQGPAAARNHGVQAAQGDLIIFFDADVSVPSDLVERMAAYFELHPQVDAAFGSYDAAPAATNFLSQYKNLLHHYTHQMGREDATTFWSACGVVRVAVFQAVGGFDREQRWLEDIELGYRLRAQGHVIHLVKSWQVKHWKAYSPASLLQSDIMHRAVPWTELLYRYRALTNDLNLGTASRLSIVLVALLLSSVGLAVFWWPALLLTVGAVAGLLALNAPLYRDLVQQRGVLFCLRALPWHWLYFLYGGVVFVIVTLWLHSRFAQSVLRPTPEKISE